MNDFANNHGVLIFILAAAIGVVLGAVAHQWSLRRHLSEIARGAAMVAGFIIGFVGTYIVIAAL